MTQPPHLDVLHKVTAQVGPIHLRLFPARTTSNPYYEYDLPWAWGATTRVTFWFNRDLRTTKSVTTRLQFGEERPTDEELADGRATVLRDLLRLLDRHGVNPGGLGDLEITEELVGGPVTPLPALNPLPDDERF